LPVTPLSMAVLTDFALFAARLLVEAQAQQFHLHLVHFVGLRAETADSRRPAESRAR
jgi:hypothetical protein